MVLRGISLFLLAAWMAFAQADTGELRISVQDSAGLALPSEAKITSQANQYAHEFDSDAQGQIIAKRLPFGRYTIEVTKAGFKPETRMVDIHSALPVPLKIVLALGAVSTTITVNSDQTLINPGDVSSAYHLGNATLQDRLTPQPGRSLADLVNQQPGWLLEANGVLHPRGEEYQSQYVVDGLPLTENRSAAFVPDFDANNVQEMSIYTAGFPAEYGRKMGGVIEVETRRDPREGFHGRGSVSGGNFTTMNAFFEGQYGWGKNTLTLSSSAGTTDRYLDPPVLQNYTNHGTLQTFMAHYERDLTDRDRIGVILRREQSKFVVPNEIIQQAAGQRQDRQNFETAAQFSYQHIFSPNVLGDIHAMARDITARYWSNDLSTPMIAGQDRAYHEAYVRGTVSVHTGIHEIKAGFESDYASIVENLNYLITDPSQFDPATPLSFSFYGRAPDREQGAFGQDSLRWKNLTVEAGLRFDHYSLLVDQVGWSPRVGVALYWPQTKIVFRASYDRVFETPAFENILISSSPDLSTLSDQVLRLPVQPARGNYYQAGFGRALFSKVKVNGNFYWRRYHNFPDDELLLNTGISFPITFALANIYGAEAKIEVPQWGRFSGFASYGNMRGNGYFPVTGGLFLGQDAAQAVSATSGVFPVTQDQRTTIRARLRYNINSRFWAAIGGTYDSGIPIDFVGDYSDAVQQYGPAIVNRVNFADARPYPLKSLNASLGLLIRHREHSDMRFQIDGTNLTNEVNVLDFAGLFSGTAIGITRSVNARLQFAF